MLAFFASFILVDDILMPSVVRKGDITTVPAVLGLESQKAIMRMRESGLNAIESAFRNDPSYPRGTVSKQVPPPGTTVKRGRNVYLTISGGEQYVSVPSLEGRSLRDATFTLERYRLHVGSVTYEESDSLPENVVIVQLRSPGSRVIPGTSVDLIVSLGSSGELALVPDVTGKPLEDAEKLLLRAGFPVGKISYEEIRGVLPNTVYRQVPKGKELFSKGKGIELVVVGKPGVLPGMEN